MTTSRERRPLQHHLSGARERIWVLAMLAAVFVAFVLVLSVTARAAPVFNVDATKDAVDATPGDGRCATDDGACTLRAAIQEAEVAGGSVVLPAGTFKLTVPAGSEGEQFLANQPDPAKGDLDISKNITVKGAGPEKTVIDAQDAFRIFDVHATNGVLGLEQVRLTRGKGDYDRLSQHYHGGAIHNHSYIHLSHVVVDNSSSPEPGSLPCQPPTWVASCSEWGGGGITNADKSVADLDTVTVARNRTKVRGGGIENYGRLTTHHVTIAENTAPAGTGGGVSNGGTGQHLTSHTLIAENPGGDCWLAGGTVGSTGYNLHGDGTCGFNQATDQKGDAAFEPGLPGAPLYYAITSLSRAEDTGGEGQCSGTDIRGVTRPQDSDGDTIVECDIGSYEKAAAGAQRATLSVSSATATEGQAAARLATAAKRPPAAGRMRFLVTLSSAAKKPVTVRAATVDRTARAGADYKAKKGLLRFAPGQTSKPFIVKVLRDGRAEGAEKLKVKLSGATNARIERAQATGTILKG